MIRVQLAKEPTAFDGQVRQPGLDAIRELVGEPRKDPRPGPLRSKVAECREAIPASAFPDLWRRALPDLLQAYGRICAYLSLYIELGTGLPTVDHMLPRSKAWDKVYEWSNYRLACALMNTRKGTDKTVLDPCQIGDGWFELEIVACQVRPGNAVTGNELAQVQATIDSLRLNDQQCCRARDEYVTRYRDGEIELAFLERRAPFIARELRRQGLLQDGDT